MARPPFQVGDFIGQRKIIAPLLVQQDGAMARGEPLSHCLFTGPSGLGKSLLGRTLAQRGRTAMAKFLRNVEVDEVVGGLSGLKPCDVVFLDEAHRLSNEVQELLFEVIDARTVPAKYAPLPLTSNTKEPLQVAPLTLILATDQPGRLLNALYKRIPLRVHFEPYPEIELREIVERVASRRGLLLSPQAARRLAQVCSGLPRRAEHYVAQVRHHFPDSEQRQLTVGDITQFLTRWGIDEHGLSKQERRYLRFLARNRTASLATLASVLGFDVEHVRTQVEQPLRYRGLIRIRSSGRELTKDGARLVKEWRAARQARKKG